MQAAQAETVTRQHSASRSGASTLLEPCEKCRLHGRAYTTTARVGASEVAVDCVVAGSNGARAATASRPPSLPTGTLAALNHIARREGPAGLYRGLDVALLMAVPSTVLYYTVYDDMLERLEAAGGGKILSPITSGASARIIATIFMAPLELVRTRVQAERASSSSGDTLAGMLRGRQAESRGLGGLPLAQVGRAVSNVVREEGFLALWRGVGTTMWRDVPFSMIYWLGYENLKDRLGCGRLYPGDRRDSSGDGGGSAVRGGPGDQRASADYLMRSFVAGAMSGVVASLLTHPFDVVKTQQQIEVQGVQGKTFSLAGVDRWLRCWTCNRDRTWCRTWHAIHPPWIGTIVVGIFVLVVYVYRGRACIPP